MIKWRIANNNSGLYLKKIIKLRKQILTCFSLRRRNRCKSGSPAPIGLQISFFSSLILSSSSPFKSSDFTLCILLKTPFGVFMCCNG